MAPVVTPVTAGACFVAPGPAITLVMDHTAQHGLPISNGYGSGSNGITVYCGRCQGTFRADADWVARYFNASRRKVESDTYMGPGARADALARIDARESQVLEQIASA